MSGKVPESAVGISAKVTELELNPRRYFIYLANGHWTERPPPHDVVATAAARGFAARTRVQPFICNKHM